MSFIIGEGGKRINEGRANKCEEIREAVWKDVKCIRYIFPFFFFFVYFSRRSVQCWGPIEGGCVVYLVIATMPLLRESFGSSRCYIRPRINASLN